MTLGAPSPPIPRQSLGRAHMLASWLLQEIGRLGLAVDHIVPAGGVRRFAPDVGSVTLLAIAPPEIHALFLRGVAGLQGVRAVVPRDAGGFVAHTDRGGVTLHVESPEHAGAALVWHTGSRGHIGLLRARAQTFGLAFEAGRLLDAKGRPVPCASEEALYARLSLPVIQPELRHGGDELVLADEGQLPDLLTGRDIRGDLHMHTTWSDGRDTLATMVLTARTLGYEYVAITDHSEHATSSRTLSRRDVARQRAEIEALRDRVDDIAILHGVEVDIMPDGTLDFDDTLLSGFDIVLASLHDDAGHHPDRLLERYDAALRHPLVSVITHPANRSPARFPGYALDYDRLFETAAATGTALEVDGAPGHLDMDGALARRAAEAGVTLAVNSDCHRADALARQMRFGIGTARRGLVRPEAVLNTRSLEDVQAFVAAKRAGRSPQVPR
ncbi:MAG: DNA polymerase/3'-5' exonuclease PolX [Vicinamibacterales bacterium]